MTGPAAIEFRSVSFSYGAHRAIDNASFAIPAGDFACIVGPNGGGKTTLIKLTLGLLSPVEGSIRVFGIPPAEARRRIGYMPQRAGLDPLFPVTVSETVLMGRLGGGRTFGPFARGDRALAAEALAKVGMADYRNRLLGALSGGQQQRVLIARALACQPDLLLLDEPTAGLDVAIEGEFYELLLDLNRHLTVVMASHDLGFVSRYVRSVICVKRKVSVHPTSAITGEIINEIYGSDMHLVRHDHRCAASGHENALAERKGAGGE